MMYLRTEVNFGVLKCIGRSILKKKKPFHCVLSAFVNGDENCQQTVADPGARQISGSATDKL